MNASPHWDEKLAEMAQETEPVLLRVGEDVELVVHPQPDAMLITVWRAQGRTGLETLLRERWRSPQQLGHWMPVLFADGQPALLGSVSRDSDLRWPQSGLVIEAAIEALS
jgi:hypothetical protein